MNRQERRAAVSGRARSAQPTRGEHRVRLGSAAGRAPSLPKVNEDTAAVVMQALSLTAQDRVGALRKSLEDVPDGDDPHAILSDRVLGMIAGCCDRFGEARDARDPMSGIVAIADMINAALALRRLLALDGTCDCPRCVEIRKQASRRSTADESS